MNGKGDRTRPKTVSRDTWDKNYEQIFKKESSKEQTTKDERKD